MEQTNEMRRSAVPATPLVTVVLATYNRPGTLVHAITSVVAQTEPDWRLLVVGDCCGDETGKAVRAFDDPRIDYVNLPMRCGEQSGPNSVGMRLATGRYIAFLNHDDVWFPDHVQTALSGLAQSNGDFFVGRAAFAEPETDGSRRLSFTQTSPTTRRLRNAFFLNNVYFEPSSSWVVRRSSAQRVGDWRSSTELHRTPLADWVLRAWRAGLALTTAPAVTVIKPRLLPRRADGRASYDETPPDYADWAGKMAADPAVFRDRVLQEIESAGEPGMKRALRRDPAARSPRERAMARELHERTASLYFWTGRDRFDQIADRFGRRRGQVLRTALKKRTGEDMMQRPDLKLLSDAASAQLIADVDG